jgi:hypothetical protein
MDRTIPGLATGPLERGNRIPAAKTESGALCFRVPLSMFWRLPEQPSGMAHRQLCGCFEVIPSLHCCGVEVEWSRVRLVASENRCVASGASPGSPPGRWPPPAVSTTVTAGITAARKRPRPTGQDVSASPQAGRRPFAARWLRPHTASPTARAWSAMFVGATTAGHGNDRSNGCRPGPAGQAPSAPSMRDFSAAPLRRARISQAGCCGSSGGGSRRVPCPRRRRRARSSRPAHRGARPPGPRRDRCDTRGSRRPRPDPGRRRRRPRLRDLSRHGARLHHGRHRRLRSGRTATPLGPAPRVAGPRSARPRMIG